MPLVRRVINAVHRRLRAARLRTWPPEGSWRRTPDGLWMFLRPQDFFDEIYAYSAPDGGFRQLVPRIVRPGDWAIDCGGQKGWYALFLARAVGPEGRVLTIEADPVAADLLQANLERNKASSVTLVREAVGDVTQEVEFLLNDVIGWSSRTPNVNQSKSVRARVVVPMRPLDDIVRAANPPAGARITWLKLDIEGGETAALRGATRLLRDHRPLLWMEINPGSLAAAHSSPAELGALLEGLGYRFWRVQGDDRWLRRPRAWFVPLPRLSDVRDEMDVVGIPPALLAEWAPRLDAAPSPEQPLR